MYSIIKFLFTGWMLRILVVLALVYGLYFYKVWPFDKNVSNLDFLEEKYCNSENEESQAICECILVKVKADLETRFTKEELKDLKSDRLKSAYSLQKSLESVKASAQNCLEEKGEENAWRRFTTDLATLDNKFLGKIGDLVNKGVDKLKAEWDSRKKEKLEIDSKY